MDKNLTLKELSDWLKHLNKMPKKTIRKLTYMDIAGINHLENHWSFIYLYFFNPKGSHGLSRLFVDTLQKIILEETGKEPLKMDSFNVSREEGVRDEKGNNKRIDILLQSDEEAIIIENKVNANLYNRLDLYWKRPSMPDDNKRGVVFSLKKIETNHPNFICITHERFAKAIECALPDYFRKVEPKALIFLQDFIQNIYNVTHSMNEEEIKFYFDEENRKKINRLAEIRNNGKQRPTETIFSREWLETISKEKG